MLQESELDGERLAREIDTLVANPDRITAMERAAGRLARPDAASRVADLVDELMA